MRPEDDPWFGAAVYQIYPRSFADSDGDGVGDLKGITARLEHVASLGVDAIWLSPFYRSPMADFGYDIADFCDVDPVFGTLADFDALIERAHALGLKVIVDQVYCHASDHHPWFKASREARHGDYADWFVWADAKPDGSPPSNWQSVFGGPAWTWDARRGQYYLHNFLPQQPQLNLHHPPVRQAMLDVARFWRDRGVDGFRLDAINFALFDSDLTDNPPAPPGPRTRPFDFQLHLHNQSQPGIADFLTDLRAEIGDAFTVAEVVGADAQAEMRAFTDPGRLSTAYGFQFLYADRLTPALVRDSVQAWDDGWPAWAFSNHDAPRAVSRWAPEAERKPAADMLLALLTCLRGTIFLYQGEELGLPQAEVPFDRLIDPEAIANWPMTLGRDGARTPMPWASGEPYAGFSTTEPWLPVDPRHAALAVDVQDADPRSTLNLTRRLLALRRSRALLRTGAFRWIDAPDPLIVFQRGEGDDRLLCAFNAGSAVIQWELPQGWRPIDGDVGAPWSWTVAERA